jgi:hypothetical protein
MIIIQWASLNCHVPAKVRVGGFSLKLECHFLLSLWYFDSRKVLGFGARIGHLAILLNTWLCWAQVWSQFRIAWYVSSFMVVGLLSTTTVCSGRLIYLLNLGEVIEEVMGRLVNCHLPSGLSPGLERNWWGQFNWPLPWTYARGASIPPPCYLSAATGS